MDAEPPPELATLADLPFHVLGRHPKPLLYSVYNHTYHPRLYGDPVEEYWQLLNGVTLWDVTRRKQVWAQGWGADDRSIRAVAVTPDGKKVACGGKAGIVGLWDATTGMETRRIRAHERRRVLRPPGQAAG